MKALQRINPLNLDNYFDTAVESFLSPFLKMENDHSYGWCGPWIERTATENGLQIKFIVPGYGKDDLDVNLQEGMISVKGDGIDLATNIPYAYKYDLTQLEAACDKGILLLTAPYKEEEKGRKVEVT